MDDDKTVKMPGPDRSQTASDVVKKIPMGDCFLDLGFASETREPPTEELAVALLEHFKMFFRAGGRITWEKFCSMTVAERALAGAAGDILARERAQHIAEAFAGFYSASANPETSVAGAPSEAEGEIGRAISEANREVIEGGGA